MSKKCKLTAIELYDMIIIGSYGDFCMRKIILLTLSALTILIIGSVIVISNKPVNNLITYDEKTILALYNENGEKIDQVPSKDSGYTLDTEKSSCTNGSVSWNYESWSPVVAVSSEVKERVSCNLYFKEIEILRINGIYEKAIQRVNRTFIMKTRNAIRILVAFHLMST